MLRTCTPEKTEQMTEYVNSCIMEAVQVATGVDFDMEEMAKERMRIPSRMKGGEIRRATDTIYPAFLGGLLDVLPRCIDKMEDNGDKCKGYHSEQLTNVIGEGAYDNGGHRNAQFMGARNGGPSPGACMRAWKSTRDEAMQNLGVRDEPEQEGDGKRWDHWRTLHQHTRGIEGQRLEGEDEGMKPGKHE